MAGRTVSKWFNFVVDDSAGVIRDIPVYTVSIVGVVYEEQDLTALADQVRGAMANMPDCPIEITGPMSTKSAVPASGSGVAAAYSGSQTVLEPISKTVITLTLDCQFGIQRVWTTNDPQFGISMTTGTIGYNCTSYVVDPATMIYTCKFAVWPGSTLPAWGTTAET
jgi:hypothetical protein